MDLESAKAIILLLILVVFVGIPAWLAFSFARRGKNEQAVVAFLSTVLVPIVIWWVAQWLIDLMYSTGYCRGSTTGLYGYCNGIWEPGLTQLADALYGWFPATATIASFVYMSVRWARASQSDPLSGADTRARSD